MKIAPILRELENRSIDAQLVHTGQHYDAAMSDVFFEQLGMRAPDVHLQVGSGTHGLQTGTLLIEFERYLLGRRILPRWVVVVGDVNSTVACGLAAVKLGVSLCHVEAGLRSHDRGMPEEVNRKMTDTISDLLLVSEPDGLKNLKREGVAEERVRYVGNVMIDSLVDQLAAARELAMPSSLGLAARDYALVTLHRPSNVDSKPRLEALLRFLRKLSSELPVVFPVHPRTGAKLAEFSLESELASCENVIRSEPLGYRNMLGLMADARLVLSDSGGIQEETSYLRVPCITLRPNTERPVTVTSGTNTVVGEDLDAAWREASRVLGGRYKEGAAIRGWDGKAAERIVDALLGAAPPAALAASLT